jgi:hypothetical protein
MKIIIKNQNQNPVFTLDVETGKAEAHVPVNDCAAEFLRGLETVLTGASSIRDILLEAGKGEGSGNLVIRMGDAGPTGAAGGDVTITNPSRTRRCTDCKDGTQTLATTMGPCTTCKGTMLVPDCS